MSNAETVANVAGKQARNAMERVSALEEAVDSIGKTVNSIIGPINNTFSNLQQQLSQAVEILDVLVKEFGPEKVEASLLAERKARLAAKQASEKQTVEEGVKAGTLKVADTVTPEALLVFEESDKDGKVMEFPRAQFWYKQLLPNFQTQIANNLVGFKMVSPENHTFELKEIYVPVQKPAETVASAEAPVAPQA